VGKLTRVGWHRPGYSLLQDAETAWSGSEINVTEALKEVLDAAKQPKQFPSGAKPVALTGEALVRAINSKQVKGRAWHESLTPAQETVCRWIWETCAQHWEA